MCSDVMKNSEVQRGNVASYRKFIHHTTIISHISISIYYSDFSFGIYRTGSADCRNPSTVAHQHIASGG